MEVTISRTSVVKYLSCILGVRHWEDAEVNGKTLSESGDGMPLKTDSNWSIKIDLDLSLIHI